MQNDFVRFIPKHPSPMIPQLFLRVLEEMFRLDPGNLHLTEGYCERILYLLPTEYQIMLTDVERRDSISSLCPFSRVPFRPPDRNMQGFRSGLFVFHRLLKLRQSVENRKI